MGLYRRTNSTDLEIESAPLGLTKWSEAARLACNGNDNERAWRRAVCLGLPLPLHCSALSCLALHRLLGPTWLTPGYDCLAASQASCSMRQTQANRRCAVCLQMHCRPMSAALKIPGSAVRTMSCKDAVPLSLASMGSSDTDSQPFCIHFKTDL